MPLGLWVLVFVGLCNMWGVAAISTEEYKTERIRQAIYDMLAEADMDMPLDAFEGEIVQTHHKLHTNAAALGAVQDGDMFTEKTANADPVYVKLKTDEDLVNKHRESQHLPPVVLGIFNGVVYMKNAGRPTEKVRQQKQKLSPEEFEIWLDEYENQALQMASNRKQARKLISNFFTGVASLKKLRDEIADLESSLLSV